MRSLLSMAFSLFVIIGYIIPHILAGEDPLWVSITGFSHPAGCDALSYLRLESQDACCGRQHDPCLADHGHACSAICLFTRLTGSGDENSLFLIQMLNTQINLRGLLLGGMIIGALACWTIW